MKASWNGKIIAESDDTVVVEGDHYFPAESLRPEFVAESDTITRCPRKGTASYFSLSVNGDKNKDAAWYYPNPKDAAQAVAGRVAFWKGVVVSH